LIIENAGKGAAWMRRRDAALSAAMWVVYLYWIRDALVELGTLAAEGFAWAFMGAALPELRTIGLFGTTVLPYLAVVVGNAILLILWARYNQARFRGHERHCNVVSVSPAELGALYSMKESDVIVCQAARRMTIRHASDGAIIGIAFDQNGVSRVCAPSTTVATEGGGEV
jgi:biofilm PGA synthesis protein PgaD